MIIIYGIVFFLCSSAWAGALDSALHTAASGPAWQYLAWPLSCVAAAGAAAFVVGRRARRRHERLQASTALDEMHKEMQTLAAEREAAMCRLQDNHRLLNAITLALPHGIFWKDSKNVYRGCNEQFAALMGLCKCEQVVGKTDRQLLDDRAKADFYVRCDEEVMQTGIALLDMRETVITSAGARVDLLVNKLPLRDSAGNIIGIIGITTDVASETRTSDAGKAAEPMHTGQRVEHGLSPRVNHAIHIALDEIAGFAEILALEPLTAGQAHLVEMIVTSADNIRAAIEAVLGLSSDSIDDSDRPNNAPGPFAANDNAADVETGSAELLCREPGEYTILIVDDVPENRMLLDVLLKRQGYKTVQCSSGSDAVELCESERFDIVLMDIRMAGMDGLEATRTIRSRDLNAQTPILAITASGGIEDEQQCLKAGCDDCIRKPVRKDTLLHKVHRFLERQEQIRIARLGGEITSLLSYNPDYRKTIETFVENLPNRIRQMQQALDSQNLQELAFKAHALKGLGGFAGFPIYTELARSIEQAAHDSHLNVVRQKLDEMVAICRRTRLFAQ